MPSDRDRINDPGGVAPMKVSRCAAVIRTEEASAMHEARNGSTRPRVKAWLERVTGGLLIALGARLAWERR